MLQRHNWLSNYTLQIWDDPKIHLLEDIFGVAEWARQRNFRLMFEFEK